MGTMKDFVGNELAVGDEVILVKPRYREFVKGNILKMTAQTVFLEYMHQNYRCEVKQDPSQLIKVVKV
jgi:uncharacterized Zn ribbon protein